MSKINGTVFLSYPLVPMDSLIPDCTHDEQYGKGGYRSVQTKEDLYKIPIERLNIGSIVYVIETGENYQVKNLDNIISVTMTDSDNITNDWNCLDQSCWEQIKLLSINEYTDLKNSIEGFKVELFEVLTSDQLPSASTAKENVIYLLPSGDEKDNYFLEYVVVNNDGNKSWELVGSIVTKFPETIVPDVDDLKGRVGNIEQNLPNYASSINGVQVIENSVTINASNISMSEGVTFESSDITKDDTVEQVLVKLDSKINQINQNQGTLTWKDYE